MDKPKIIITKEIHNALVKSFAERAAAQGLKGKKLLHAESDFFVGAVSVIDIMDGNTEASCCTPQIYFSLLRGERIKAIEE